MPFSADCILCIMKAVAVSELFEDGTPPLTVLESPLFRLRGSLSF